MAEAVTYADLRFVKAPLQKSLSGRLGPEAGAYEDGDADGELTYENVQVPTAPGGAGGASSGRGDQTGLGAERTRAPWSPASPAAARTLPGPAARPPRLLLGLLLACLLLGVATVCLGVRYLQVSQQLQRTNRVLEATNSSLWQQLRQKVSQLGQKEGDLQESREELARSQDAHREEQRAHQAAKEQLHTCQLDGEKTKDTLQRQEEQREALERRLGAVRDTLKPFFKCPSEDACCLMGWTLHQKRCFYFSPTEKTWEGSRNHCTSLSSKLATFSQTSQYYSRTDKCQPCWWKRLAPWDHNSPQNDSPPGMAEILTHYLPRSLSELLSGGGSDSYWVGSSSHRVSRRTWSTDDSSSWYYYQFPNCAKVQKDWSYWKSEKCTDSLRYICELEAFKFPDRDHSLH
ncbi:PREDICTED: B-cell differentiation antigen CD72 isoform X2 [Chinchilla lanigera]|uniref:B-cell differentiation antigen CD72 isoform X2 n=1 Tax=Chinchilla lanigera TaxID=34839 RepID=UPI0006972C4B|nr:PREDICTED: B-cell differentiation antigen CD72 isoform X2 [Chinchilla lanigera]